MVGALPGGLLAAALLRAAPARPCHPHTGVACSAALASWAEQTPAFCARAGQDPHVVGVATLDSDSGMERAIRSAKKQQQQQGGGKGSRQGFK